MKYFRKNDGEVYAFESDDAQDDFITDDMKQMTDNEVDRHLYPEKYLSKAEKYQVYLKTLHPLTRRQFMLTLVENDLDKKVESAIANIEDVKQRKMISIEYKDAQSFERFSESVLSIAALIGLDEKKLNALWENAMML
ncbi:MAG: hypothetical protein GAK29_00867 [Acinetobacter bereziniae]|uniref:Uncharacterized protein n=1 Tax=Acinetobacter bereziniae TaxID=106648 RepID=A0A833PE95_ACIBZ|nr:MAG: hypothetical protein GAK29_00867 [Acinetobacter bereziniae]